MKAWRVVGLLLLLGAPGGGVIFGNGQVEQAPTIQMGDQARIFIAPGNPEAQIKSLALPFSTLTFSAKNQAIKSWTFTVFDSNGKTVFEDSRLETRDRGFFGELFNIGDRPQVEIPKELAWNGTYKVKEAGLTGKLVPDGNYTYQISIVDTAGGRAQTPPFNVTVRNSKATIDYIRLPYTIFSPSGTRATLSIEQSGSREVYWSGVFSDKTGRVVRTYIWQNTSDNQLLDAAPPAFDWDGKDQTGKLLPEGDYFYTLRGHNRSGYQVEQRYPFPLTLNLQKGLINLKGDVAIFSPLAEGVQNVINFTTDFGSVQGVTSWSLKISKVNHLAVGVWARSGNLPLPEKITFDGKDTLGQYLPEGRYEAVLSATYNNGNSAESPPVVVDIDMTPPKGELKANFKVFGGEGRSSAVVTFSGTPGIPWELAVMGPQGKTLSLPTVTDTGLASLEVTGIDGSGQALADGPITVIATARSLSGIPAKQTLQLEKDSRSMKVDLDLSNAVLVPGATQLGSLRLTPVLEVVDSIENMTFQILGEDGKPVAKKLSDGIITFWDWNGRGESGETVANGKYKIDLSVAYTNGTIAHAGKDLVVDSKFLSDKSPQVEMSLSSKTFVPGNVDGPTSLQVKIKTIEGANPVEGWQLNILDPRGKNFRVYSGKGLPPEKLEWDGRSAGGEIVESGEDYQLVLRVWDNLKRETRKQEAVTIDILVTKLAEGKYKIVINSIQFAGFSSDIFKVRADLLNKNLFVLRRLSTVLNKFPGYRIRLEGYAVSEFWNDPKLAEEEQRTQLIPLSLDRAEEVHTALVLLGVDSERFTVTGFGSERPLVPNSDLENRWKNRRVEFYLDKM